MKEPENFSIDEMRFILEYNYSNESETENYYSASWRYNDNNRNGYFYLSVAELSDQNLVEERLNQALENGICNQRNVSMDYDNSDDNQIAYVCKNIWRLAYDNQRVSSQTAWNYQNDAIVLWFNENKLFNLEFSFNNYYGCDSSEECERRDQENHRMKQEDLISSIDTLINNQMQWTSSGYLDYNSERVARYFLNYCSSQVVEQERPAGDWSCRFEPVICPEYGEQKQICVRWNQNIKKTETREATLNCNPGICSGCMVPRWFGDDWESKCIPYGFRLKQQNGWNYEIVKFSDNDEIGEGEANDFVIDYIDSEKVTISTYWNNQSYTLREGESTILDLSGFEDHNITLEIKMTVQEIIYQDYVNGTHKVLVQFDVVENQRSPANFNAYCEMNGKLEEQKADFAECQNNYECDSNLCSGGECIAIKKMINDAGALKSFGVKLLCRIASTLGVNEYDECLVGYLGDEVEVTPQG